MVVVGSNKKRQKREKREKERGRERKGEKREKRENFILKVQYVREKIYSFQITYICFCHDFSH